MLKARQRLGKYRVVRRLADGGFAEVFEAYDTIEGVSVALKVPHRELLTEKLLADFRAEARMAARLDHPNILPIKYAGYLDDTFVIVYPLGEKNLHQRLKKRISARKALVFAEQMVDAIAYAHRKRIIHSDIKPENFILFPEDRLRLSDFGLAKIALGTRTLDGSGAGTIGYMAPEQALGKLSYPSDVFSLGLVIYRMFAGVLPEWPFDWPMLGYRKLKQVTHPDFIRLLRKALELREEDRYRDGVRLQRAFRRVRGRAVKAPGRPRRKSTGRPSPDWRSVRFKEFRRRVGKGISIQSTCSKCGGPISEVMSNCPWCGRRPKIYRGKTSFPARCHRCGRGVKLDWRFCPWCFGSSIGPRDARSYSDVRYSAKCRSCRNPLMPFMRYCPWCRTKVRRPWRIEGWAERCPRCRNSVTADLWSRCAWCARTLDGR